MTDKQNTELLPCPFCRGEAELKATRWKNSGEIKWYRAKCGNCKAQVDAKIVCGDAIKAWDTRAALAPPEPVDVEGLKREVCMNLVCQSKPSRERCYADTLVRKTIDNLNDRGMPNNMVEVDVDDLVRQAYDVPKYVYQWNDCLDYLKAQGIKLMKAVE